MKRTLRNVIALLLALVMLIGSLPVIALAATEVAIWASPISDNTIEEERPISAVKWWYDTTDAVYYLFMPTACDTSDMQIWLDGTASCTVDGVTYTDGATIGSLTVGSHTVVINGTSYPVTVMQSSNIGTMYITTESGNMDYIHAVKGNKESGYMKMIDADGKTVYDNTLDEIKGRGNATWSRPKKPYQIKLDKKTDLTGDAGKNKTWILLANYLERSLMRNSVTYGLAYEAGMTNAGLSTYVDLYCNGKYMGTFQLTEKVHINDDRIEINNLEDTTQDVNDQDLEDYPTFGPANASTPGSRKGFEIPNNPDDITGGYLLELDHSDRYTAEASGFVTTRGQAVVIKEPEYASREQVNYIANYFQEFEDAVFAANGICPTTGKYYYEYFDLTSLARKYIIEELTKNIDADVTSQYFYKPSDSESTVGYCGPVWDYDNALGNYKSGDSLTATGLYAASSAHKNYLLTNLYEHESFLNAVYAEWENNYKPLLNMTVYDKTAPEGSKLRTIDEYYNMLKDSAAMNFTYWENINSVDGTNYNDTGDTYQEHVEFLRTFLADRTRYLDSIWATDSIAIHTSTAQKEEPSTSNLLSIQNFNGTASSYTISTEEDLQKLADLITDGNSFKGVTLVQTADITLTKEFTPSQGGVFGANISPNDYDDCFRGTYNGQGYKIYNLQINRPDDDGVAIFGKAYGATFTDMHVASGSVIGDNRVGAIAGYGDKCTFIRCSNGADITSYNVGSADGTAGIAGVSRSSAVFTSCYNTGHITGKSPAGISGWGQGNIIMTNCWNSGTITDKNNAGAALARTNSKRNFATCYYNVDCGETDTNDAIATALAAFSNGTLTANLNTTSNIWEQGETHPTLKTPERIQLIPIVLNRHTSEKLINTQYVYLNAAGTYTLPAINAFVKEIKINGEVTTETTHQISEATTFDLYLSVDAEPISSYNGSDNYFIGNNDDLKTFLELSKTDTLSGSNFFLVSDVDAGEIDISGGKFAGTLNGFYTTIRNLNEPLFEEITSTGALRKINFAGGNLDENGVVITNKGRISDVTVKDMVFYGHYAGGIVGTNSGEIINCSVQNGYAVGHKAAGGIAAINNGTIKNCINHASVVSVGSVVGGVAAFNSGLIESCINVGMLYGGTRYAIAPSSDATSYYWDWCVGEGNATALTDSELAEKSMLDNLDPAVWEEGAKFPAIMKFDYERGDANGDHIVSLADALRIMRYLNGLLTEDEIDLVAADINGDGFSIPDAIRLLQSLKGAAPKAELPDYQEETDPYTIKIVDYNVRVGNDGTNKNIADRAPRLIRVIEEYQPDIIGLQEVNPEWMTYIEANFADTYTILNKYRAQESNESTPILYKTEKYNELDHGFFWLSETPDVESKGWDASYWRICTWVKLEDKVTGEAFLYYNTHYDFTEKCREGSSNLIINHATAQGGYTEYPVLRTGSSGGYNPGVPNGIIDFVFFSPDLLTAEYYEILNNYILGGYTSDHNGIYAEVKIVPQAS